MREAYEPEVIETVDAIFGPGSYANMKEPEVLRGVRLKIGSAGDLTLAHPQAAGRNIITIQQVPASVSMASVAIQMRSVTVLRRDKTLHYSEIRAGAILR